MSLTAAFQIGRSALTASQVGLQVAGNNMANAATPGYSRQVMFLQPMRADGSGRVFLGRGVQIQDVRRQVDEALQNRRLTGVADEAAAQHRAQVVSQLESTLNELSGHDLSSELTDFFKVWSERGNGTQSDALVVQQGGKIAQYVQRLRGQLTEQRGQIDGQLGALVSRGDQLLDTIAAINTEVARAEAGGATASSLRDQRDMALEELSQILDVTAVEQPSGAVDVLVGSTPVVLGGESRGLQIKRITENGEIQVMVATRANDQTLEPTSGQIGALLAGRAADVDSAINKLDDIAARLIFEVNRIHSTGRNEKQYTTADGTLGFPVADRARALNDPDNTATAGLPFNAVNGGFYVHIKQNSTGQTRTVRIDVDLDNINSAGATGAQDDTSAEDIRAALGAIPGLSASFSADGRLQVRAATGFEFSFADDSSGALAVLGVNSYFAGKNASDIRIESSLQADPSRLASGRMVGGTFVDNGTAMELVALQDRSLAELNGRTLSGAWRDTAQAVGVKTSAAVGELEAATIVRESLDAQRAAVSGVSVDEEAINLLQYQRQYQGAARLISITDEMMQTLIQMV
ncbi:MAG: flagellar hook-associated protein FlgK [Phycisphaerales bacterium]|nr:flagellar hook-associated protein FlgK [Phycisphaerales bacterium]